MLLLACFDANSYTGFKCSLKCASNTCRKNIAILEYCVKNCKTIKMDFQKCWESGLKTLQTKPNLISNQKALMDRLESYIQNPTGQDNN